MTVAPWLAQVLDDELPNELGGRRDQLAERILGALPRNTIAQTIAESTKHVLKTRNIRDDSGDLANEIGRNAALCVAFKLEEA